MNIVLTQVYFARRKRQIKILLEREREREFFLLLLLRCLKTGGMEEGSLIGGRGGGGEINITLKERRGE